MMPLASKLQQQNKMKPYRSQPSLFSVLFAEACTGQDKSEEL